MQERRRDGRETADPGHRVRVHLPGVLRAFAFVAEKRGHAGRRFDGAADAGHMGPRTDPAIRRQARHHQVRLDRAERLVVESQVAHHTRGEVLGDEIHPREQGFEEVDPVRLRKIDRDAALVEVDRVVERIAVPGVPGGRDVLKRPRDRVPVRAAPTVQPATGFKLDDVGSEERE